MKIKNIDHCQMINLNYSACEDGPILTISLKYDPDNPKEASIHAMSTDVSAFAIHQLLKEFLDKCPMAFEEETEEEKT